MSTSESYDSLWKELYLSIEIINKTNRIVTVTDEFLSAFEKNTSIILPQDYKSFCKIFGSGTFGSFVHICGIPDIADSNEFVGYIRKSLEEINPDGEFNQGNEYNLDEYISLLNHAFIFASTSSQWNFFWDLNSYQDDDGSYDIYLSLFDNPEYYLVGRSFFDFVDEFCLGNKAFEVLPIDIQPRKSEIVPEFIF